MDNNPVLKVRSHVGRDILQSAQLFRHEHSVVWEYVANGLEYKDPATNPIVVVEIDPRTKNITVTDNGRGMRMVDLHSYFQMHGENRDRRQGKAGRGFFGTGKSAAFGIATSLTITTVRDRRRSKVRLLRSDIEAEREGNEIPVTVLEDEVDTSAANGTVVEIDNVLLKRIDIRGIIRHIERHIAHWPNASVLVNNHECEFTEPDINHQIEAKTSGTEFEALLGNCTLKIKVAKAPLEEELRGVAILSGGVWHETTLAGCERKPFADYLFGEIDVPSLAQDKTGVSPFDMSRSMQLNRRNEVVAEILRFVGVHLEAARKDLERQDRARRQTDEQKKLRQQASKIAEIINSHFREWSSKLKKTMAKAGTGRDIVPMKAPEFSSSELGAVLGDVLPAIAVGGALGGGGKGSGASGGGSSSGSRVEVSENATDKLAQTAPTVPRRNVAGGFNVEFEKMGANEKRAKYDRDVRTIYINLEHPRIAIEVAAAPTASAFEDPHFLRMAYEIAFTEYAIVLAQELSSAQYHLDPQDALFELRQTIDELSKSFAIAWRDRGVPP